MNNERLDDILDDGALIEPKLREWQSRGLGIAHLVLLALGWYWFGWWCALLMFASDAAMGGMCIIDAKLLLRRQQERFLAAPAR